MQNDSVLSRFGNSVPLEVTGDRPLATFALFAFNQEKYIREAIEGAFAQTYSPLEIILSDDCSSDRTPEIMEEMASSYRGPHAIVVRKGLKNLGTFSHILSVADIASGEIIVVAAGDDISLPYRTQFSVERLHGSDFSALSGNDVIIDSKGDEQDWDSNRFALRKEAHANNRGWVGGATAAYKKQLLQNFRKPEKPILFEDIVLSDTLHLLGKKSILTEHPLIKYRKTEENIFNRIEVLQSSEDIESSRLGRWRNYYSAKYYVLNLLKDNSYNFDVNINLFHKYEKEVNYYNLISRWMSLSIWERISLMRNAYYVGQLKWALPRVLGKSSFFRIRKLLKR